MEIAGFEIAEYNVFKFKDKVKKDICPICTPNRKPENQKKKDLELYWETGLAFCHHCHERIQLHTYKKKDIVKVYVKPKFKQAEVSSKVVQWFEGRGISKQTLVSTKVTEGLEWMPQTQKDENTIKFNYFLNGELINTKSRDGKKHFKLCKDAEKIFYNLDSIRTEKECVIVEGEIDALSFIEAGVYNVVSVPNGFNAQGSINLDYLDGYLDFFDNKDKIYLALDNDEAGVNGKEEFIRRLGAERCYIVDFGDSKDANDYLCANGKEDLKGLLSDAELTPMDNIVVLDNMTEELDDFWLNGFERGMTMDLPDFDKHFSLALKQYTLLTGVPQSGKSEFLDQMLIKLNLKYGHKVGYCSTENEPFTFHYDKLFQKLYGRRPKGLVEVESDNVKEVKTHINDNVFHVQFDKRYWLQDVLAKFTELVRRKGVRMFVIDPYNKVKLKGGSTDIVKYTEEYHILLDEFVKKHDCHLFLVAHPSKMTLQEGSGQTYVMPTAYNIKGGSEHFDMSYNVIGVNRIYETKLVHIKTLKVKFRHLGENNQDAFFSFNTVNGRYEELEYQPISPDTIVQARELDYSNWIKQETDKAGEAISIDFTTGKDPEREDNSDLMFVQRDECPF
jgi:twinkle protein